MMNKIAAIAVLASVASAATPVTTIAATTYSVADCVETDITKISAFTPSTTLTATTGTMSSAGLIVADSTSTGASVCVTECAVATSKSCGDLTFAPAVADTTEAGVARTVCVAKGFSAKFTSGYTYAAGPPATHTWTAVVASPALADTGCTGFNTGTPVISAHITPAVALASVVAPSVCTAAVFWPSTVATAVPPATASTTLNVCYLPANLYSATTKCSTVDGSCLNVGATTSYKFISTSKAAVCASSTDSTTACATATCGQTTILPSKPVSCLSTTTVPFFYKDGSQVCVTNYNASATISGTCSTGVCASVGSETCTSTSTLTGLTTKSIKAGVTATNYPNKVCFAKDCASKDSNTCYSANTCVQRGSTYFNFTASGVDAFSMVATEYSTQYCNGTVVSTNTLPTGGICATAATTRRRLALAVNDEKAVFSQYVAPTSSAPAVGAVAALVAAAIAVRM